MLEVAMCDIPVFYATTEGQTRRIAEHIASCLRARGLDSAAINVAAPDSPPIDWARVRGVFLGASLHAGKHQRAAAAFARTYASQLNARPSALFSVSLGAGSKNPSEVADAQRLAREFAAQALWQPGWVLSVAGRLAYTQYGFFKRMMMRWIAKREGGSMDTSRDHEYTDWAAVAAFANDVADGIRREQGRVLPISA
jgi:menaquinone-dependent protoporphyrinogen oxidase